MANLEHLEILKRGVSVWNKWREANLDIVPDLSYANLSYMSFGDANLSNTAINNADINNVNLSGANLSMANFTKAYLSKVEFNYTRLRGAKFNHAHIGYSIFVNTNLRGAIGLETMEHFAPSEVGINTLYLSEGNIPEVFLRGCGVTDEFITYTRSLVAAGKYIQFYSCFISYSSKDQDFVERLYADLQNKGVRCWFAPEDLKIGDRYRDKIDESIRLHDKLLLILSENSVQSQWVGDEVEAALERERREKRLVLFPIQIDNAIAESNTGWAATIRRSRHVGDFTRWKDHDSYQKAFDRLLRDLKAEDKKP